MLQSQVTTFDFFLRENGCNTPTSCKNTFKILFLYLTLFPILSFFFFNSSSKCFLLNRISRERTADNIRLNKIIFRYSKRKYYHHFFLVWSLLVVTLVLPIGPRPAGKTNDFDLELLDRRCVLEAPFQTVTIYTPQKDLSLLTFTALLLATLIANWPFSVNKSLHILTSAVVFHKTSYLYSRQQFDSLFYRRRFYILQIRNIAFWGKLASFKYSSKILHNSWWINTHFVLEME